MTAHTFLDKARFELWRIDGTNYTLAAGTDASFVTSGTEIDMSGFDSLLVVVALGTVATSGVMTVRLKNSDTSGSYGSGTVDRIGQDLANTAGADANEQIIAEVYQPRRRFVRVEYQRTGGNVQVLGMWVLRYNANDTPVVQSTSAGGVAAKQVLVSPTPSAV